MGAKVGSTGSFTTIVMVVEEAQMPGFGVKVYTVEPALAVLITLGDQEPAIEGLLVEDPGNVAGVAPLQYGPN